MQASCVSFSENYIYRIFQYISRDFESQKLAQKIDLDLYTGNIFKVSKCVRIFDSDDEEAECLNFSY